MPGPTSKNKQRSHLDPKVQAARNTLRRKGWTQVEAAEQLGVGAVHLCYVLNGHRRSGRILRAIAKLPDNPNPA